MALLADNLALIDAERMPAYLESTNPANNARYERQRVRPDRRVLAPRRRAAGGDDVAGGAGMIAHR